MSGICGIIHFDDRPVAPEALQRMAEAAAHRGPDGIAFWRDGSAGIAHLALRITPEAQRETQPLLSREGDLVLVADARIDNRDELIDLLHAKGVLRPNRVLREAQSSGKAHSGTEREAKSRGRPHPGAGREAKPGDTELTRSTQQTPGAADEALKLAAPTDAELILAAYRQWGSDCAAQLLGDFAFAIWDRQRRRLFAARDPMAMRAFYYRVEPGRLLFGTEIKQILATPGVPARLFEPAAAAHLAGPYGLPEWTFYEGIEQLAPGHTLEANASSRRTWRFWDIDPERKIRYRDDREYAEHFRELFKETVRCRLRSVRPVGVFLSGGMDSGSIASTAGRLMQEEDLACPDFLAYSWAFEELPGCDERHISTGIVRHYGLDVTDIPADSQWPLRDYPEHGPDRDEPYVSVYQALIDATLSAAKADGVGVMMSGDRGDDMMGHWVYDHAGLLRAGKWRTALSELRAHGHLVGVPFHRAVRRYALRPLLAALRGSAGADGPGSSPSIPPWIRADFADRVGLRDIIRQSVPGVNLDDPAAQMRYRMIFSRAGARWVMDAERVEARNGLSFADPWSDLRVAEFVLAVPQWELHRVTDPKRLARRAMRGIMPEPVRRSAGKIEPFALFDRGFKDRSRNTVEALMTEPRSESRGFVDSDALQGVYSAFLRGGAPTFDFWWPLSFEMWLRRFW